MYKKGVSSHRKQITEFSGVKRGRRTLTPLSFIPSSKGKGALEPELYSQSEIRKVDGGVANSESSTILAVPQEARGKLRDIGELTFGARDRSNSPPQPGIVQPTDATNTSERARVVDVTQSPWRKICDLLITAADGTLHTGTGWFISPRTLVTAGHCISVFNPGSPVHGTVRSILVMPARNGETDSEHSSFGWVDVPRENLQVHPGWANNGDLDFDYGAIILPVTAPALGEQVGWFGYGHFMDQDLDESAPILSGYPDNAPDGTQWFERNSIKEVTPTQVFYDIFTFFGQSGSPVFFRSNNRDIACAIHNWGDIPLNHGVRINPQVIAQLNDWRV
jgi:glutamyl endopeptidase